MDFFLRNVDPFPELPQGQKKCFSSKVTVCGMFELRVRICFQKEKRYEQTSTFVTIRPSRPHELVFNVQNNKF